MNQGEQQAKRRLWARVREQLQFRRLTRREPLAEMLDEEDIAVLAFLRGITEEIRAAGLEPGSPEAAVYMREHCLRK